MSTGLLALAAHTNAKADLSFKAFLYRELIQETLGFGTLLPCYMPVNINLCILRHAGPLRRAVRGLALTEPCTCCSTQPLGMKELVKPLSKPPELITSAVSSSTPSVIRKCGRGHLLSAASLIKPAVRWTLHHRGGAAGSLLSQRHRHPGFYLVFISLSRFQSANYYCSVKRAGQGLQLGFGICSAGPSRGAERAALYSAEPRPRPCHRAGLQLPLELGPVVLWLL